MYNIHYFCIVHFCFGIQYGEVERVIILEGETEELEKNVTSRAEASGRSDDTGDAVKAKLSLFAEHVLGVVEMFDKTKSKAQKVSMFGTL